MFDQTMLNPQATPEQLQLMKLMVNRKIKTPLKPAPFATFFNHLRGPSDPELSEGQVLRIYRFFVQATLMENQASWVQREIESIDNNLKPKIDPTPPTSNPVPTIGNQIPPKHPLPHVPYHSGHRLDMRYLTSGQKRQTLINRTANAQEYLGPPPSWATGPTYPPPHLPHPTSNVQTAVEPLTLEMIHKKLGELQESIDSMQMRQSNQTQPQRPLLGQASSQPNPQPRPNQMEDPYGDSFDP